MALDPRPSGSDYQSRKYFFAVEEITRVSITDPISAELISEDKPVILCDTNVCSSALKWNLCYLRNHLGEGKCTVFSSPNHVFKYFDTNKVKKYAPNFSPANQKLEITFRDFVEKLLEWKPGNQRYYLQQALSNNVGPSIVKDFLEFNWEWLNNEQKKNEWGPLTSNLLLVGMEGNQTPVHYDEQQNFFAQLVGRKRCFLFPPENYENLYPHPVYHPHDRQSQVDLENPDFDKYPRLKYLKGYEAVVGPGDVLYIPIYWWHHIESIPSEMNEETSPAGSSSAERDPLEDVPCNASVNFWYKAAPVSKIEYPLNSQHKLAITRNIEKMLLEALRDPKEVGPLLHAMVNGRFTPGAEDQSIF